MSWRPLSPWLERQQAADGQIVFTVFGAVTAFTAYFSMYAFRKPFKAATFEGIYWYGDLDLKTALVLAQLLGYMLSKWLGIKYVAEAIAGRVWLHLMTLISIAELSLVLFAILPYSLAPVAMFINGVPLGVIWGLVISYLEGRRTSDIMLVGLCISFIVGSGVVKDAALIATQVWGFSDFWMPAVVGALFYPLFGLCVWLLDQMPKPTADEVMHKTARPAMDAKARKKFVVYLWPGLIVLWFGMMCLTGYRDYRDTFSTELFKDLGSELQPGTFSQVEAVVGFLILLAVGALGLFKSNRTSSIMSFAYLLLGSVITLVACLRLSASASPDAFTYMVLTGFGSYLSYVPYSSVLYERIIGYTSAPGTVAFPMQVADSLGYLCTFVIYLQSTFGRGDASHLNFFQPMGYIVAVATSIAYILGFVYFFVIFPRGKKQNEDGDIEYVEAIEMTGDDRDKAAPLQEPCGPEPVSFVS